jgi:cyclopropane fatty-acyl-phospholipid synthase-like methyltransferase
MWDVGQQIPKESPNKNGVMASTWENYFQHHKARTPRDLYLKSLEFLKGDTKLMSAMDLGCGQGNEVEDLLKRGFSVLAVDLEARAIELVLERCNGLTDKLTTRVSSFESLTSWPSVDLFCSLYAIPFCGPEKYNFVLDQAIQAVKSGGVFVTVLFGLEDEWVLGKTAVGISEQELRSKLKDFEIVHFVEAKNMGQTIGRGEKFWHTLDVIAKRIE